MSKSNEPGKKSEKEPGAVKLWGLRKQLTPDPRRDGRFIVHYTIGVSSRALNVTSKELESPRLFCRRVREELDLVIDVPTQRAWNATVQELLAYMVKRELKEAARIEREVRR